MQTKTSVHGAINMLGLTKRLGSCILQASTSEVYGDPSVHPQPEDYWGRVKQLGLATYPVYLVHNTLGRWIVSSSASVLMALGAVLLVSLAIVQLERYPRRIIRRIGDLPARPRQPTADLP